MGLIEPLVRVRLMLGMRETKYCEKGSSGRD